MNFTFSVDGVPKGQPRPRGFAFRRANKTSVRVYDPGTAEGWKAQIALAVKPFLPPQPLTGPIRVDILFRFPRPKRLCRKKDPPGELPHTAKPDRDNCDKAVLDALKQVGLYRDDAQVCDGRIVKVYHALGGKPGARIQVFAWEAG